MKKQRRRMLIPAALVLVFAAAGILYWRKQAQATEQVSVILIQKAVDDTDFWTSVSEGGAMAAREYGADLTVMGPPRESDVDLQHQMIQEAVEAKPDAIALTPSGFHSTVPYAEEIEEAGIPLILMDSAMEQEMGEAMIATDNYEAGYKMGNYMKEFVTEDTVIGIVGHVQGSSTATERERGFRAGLGDGEKKIAEVVFCDSLSEKAYDLTCEMLEKHPEMNMIVGLNEYSAVGAARAVKALGLAQDCRMAGFDSSLEEIQLLEEGVFEAIVVQKPFNMGYLGVEAAVKAARGEKIETLVDSGSELITRETMYSEENQKLLFPVFSEAV